MSAPVDRMQGLPASEIPVGIDLGTTFSLLAYVDSLGRPVSLPNQLGDVLTPSAVLVDERSILVGREATEAALRAPEQFADCFKRDMGHPAFRRIVRGMQVPPEVLSALVLDTLRDDAQRRLGPVRRAVITVPAYFDELRRKATQDAGRLAGWDVLDIINEPTAAALSLGYERGLFGLAGVPASAARERVLVYDLGGGTFDVSLLEIEDQTFRTLATDGDVQLGGKDFDERLVDHFAQQFVDAHGIDPRTDPSVALQLWRDAQQVKHMLAGADRATMFCVHGGVRLRIEITRSQFEELTEDLLERTRHTAELVIRHAGLEWPSIDRVLTVGGATRMPMVGRMLRELTGKEIDRSLSPDEAVAHGAALYADMLLGWRSGGGKRNCELINVNSHSLGVVGLHQRSGQKVNAVIIPRNTPIPVEFVKTFRTARDAQLTVAVPVVEGESERPEYCVALGQCVVRDLPPGLPQGTPVEVRYRYLANGRLSISARIPSTDQTARVEIERSHSAVAEDLAWWRRRLLGLVPAARVPAPAGTPLEALDAPAADTPDPANPADRSSVIKQLDSLYVRLGQLAEAAQVPASALASQRAAGSAARELQSALARSAEAARSKQAAIGPTEAVRAGAALSQALSAERQAETKSTFAWLVLGRECANASFCPLGAEADLQRIRYLKSLLDANR